MPYLSGVATFRAILNRSNPGSLAPGAERSLRHASLASASVLRFRRSIRIEAAEQSGLEAYDVSRDLPADLFIVGAHGRSVLLSVVIRAAPQERGRSGTVRGLRGKDEATFGAAPLDGGGGQAGSVLSPNEGEFERFTLARAMPLLARGLAGRNVKNVRSGRVSSPRVRLPGIESSHHPLMVIGQAASHSTRSAAVSSRPGCRRRLRPSDHELEPSTLALFQPCLYALEVAF